MEIKGRVYVKQDVKQLRCNELIYDDASGTITLLGDVRIKKAVGDELLSQKVVIDINKEEVRTKEKSEIEFTIKDKKS